MGFRNDFIWGAATSAYQIEGATKEDGKGPTVWDEFCRQPKAILNGEHADIACDHYHRYQEDIAMMKQIMIEEKQE